MPFVGRENTRDVLWAELDRVARERRPRLVLLHGPAGTGKSRLAAWLAQSAHALGQADVLSTTHNPLPSPNDGLAGLLRRHLRVEGLERDETFARVQHLLDSDDPARTEDTWSVAALTALVAPDPDPRSALLCRPEERFEVVRSILADATRLRPALLLLDDVPFGEECIRFARRLLQPGPDRELPALIVMTARDESLAQQPGARELLDSLGSRLLRLPVTPLPRGDQEELVERMLGLSGPLASTLSHRSGGNPLFAVQLVTSWVQRGLLEPQSGGFALARGATGQDLPDDLHAVWSQRLGQLAGADELPALEVAAALGQEVDAAEWSGACARRGLRPEGDLVERLVEARLAVRTPGGWAFVHGMLRESLERMARWRGRWRAHHVACIDVLRQIHPPGPELDSRVGRHHFAAGAWSEAIEPLLAAADARRRGGDSRAAAALLSLREDALERLDVPPDDVRWAEGHVPMAQALTRMGRFSEAVERAERVDAATGRPDLRSDALRARAMAARLQGDLPTADRLTSRALELASGCGHREGVALCVQGLGTIDRLAGRLDSSEERLERAGSLHAELGDGVGVAACSFNLAVLFTLRGEHGEAETRYRHAIELFHDAGQRMGLANSVNGLGESARLQGRLEEARSCYRQALRLYRAVGGSQVHIPSLNLVLLDLRAGRAARAARLARETRDLLERRGSRGLLPFVDAALLQAAAMLGAIELFEASARELDAWLDLEITPAADVIRDTGELLAAAEGESRRRGRPTLLARAAGLRRRFAERTGG